MNEQIIQAAMLGDPQAIQQIVMAAMQGDEQATAILQLAQEAAQQGDQNAAQFLQMAELVAQLMQQQVQAARNGAKILYLKYLRGECNSDEELVYFKAGGRICKKCMKKGSKLPKQEKVEKNCGGGISKHMAAYKAAHGGNLKNKHTAFGDKCRTPENTDHQGHKANHRNGTARQEKPTRNRFTAFGDTGKYKPTNVGLVGHKATGATSRMLSKQTVKDSVNKHTAFGSHINRYMTTGKASSVGGIKQGSKPRSKTGIYGY